MIAAFEMSSRSACGGRRILFITSVLVASALSLQSAAAAERPAVAVLEISDSGAGASLAKNITDVVTASLAELNVLDVLSRADIQRMLQFETEKQMLGCASDSSCLAEVGGALGVAMLVTGSIGKVGDAIILSLILTDTTEGRVIERVQRRYGSLNELAEDTAGASRYLVRELLQRRQGELLVKVSETGAQIEIDGKLIGQSPMSRQTLAGGPHRIEVSKKGFVTWSKDIDLEAKDLSLVDVLLVPSLEFIEAYDEDASRWRLGAYLSAGLGVAAVGFGAYTYFGYNAARTSNLNADIEASGCVDGAPEQPDLDCEASFASRRDSIHRWDKVAIGSLAAGVLLSGLGGYLWAAGPEPGVYDQYKMESSLATAHTATLTPTRGGAKLSAEWTF